MSRTHGEIEKARRFIIDAFAQISSFSNRTAINLDHRFDKGRVIKSVDIIREGLDLIEEGVEKDLV